MNDITHLTDNRYLITDSYKGAIWEINITAKTAQIWVQHERLARSDANHPFPAVNRLKIYSNTLYASNTQRQRLIRIPIKSDYTAGTLDRWLTNVNLDDFTFDGDGNPMPQLTFTTVCSRCPRWRNHDDRQSGTRGCRFYRTRIWAHSSGSSISLRHPANGGMSLPLPTGLEAAKVVRLDIGSKGLVN